MMNGIVQNAYWQWESALSKDFCEFVLKRLDWSPAVSGEVETGVTESIRRSEIIWQSGMEPLGCIAKTYMDTANINAGWNYPLLVQEDTQIGRYRSDNQGFYNKHVDAGPPVNGLQRKLSISILLNDPSEFEGGELQFTGITDRKILPTQGSIVVFPSFVEHNVTPVTKGVRYSAVTWASGPAFR
jgi:PKHD-type hydroxylase